MGMIDLASVEFEFEWKLTDAQVVELEKMLVQANIFKTTPVTPVKWEPVQPQPTPPPAVTTAEVADVLERAADFYQSGQYGWCAGKWTTFKGEEHPLSVCAASCLALAAGVQIHMISRFEELSAYNQSQLRSMTLGYAKELELYIQARKVVDAQVEGFRTVIQWNDAVVGDGHGVPHDYARSKDDVVQLFLNAAKDLRNQDEALVQ